MQAGRFIDVRAFFFYYKVFIKCSQELFRSQTIKIFHHTVVINDGQLICREANSHKVIIFFITAMIWIQFCFLCSHQCSSGRTVMAVSNIKGRHFSKFGSNCSNICLLVDNPESMSKTITRSDKVINRLICCIFLYYNIQLLIVRISKENRFNISVVHTYMFHTILFLVTTGKLMLLDNPVHIIRDISTDYQPILCFPVHRLGIDIIVFHLILHQPAFVLKQLEILGSFSIHLFVMFIRTNREIYFRFNNMIKRLLVTFRFCAGFFRIQYIIRT